MLVLETLDEVGNVVSIGSSIAIVLFSNATSSGKLISSIAEYKDADEGGDQHDHVDANLTDDGVPLDWKHSTEQIHTLLRCPWYSLLSSFLMILHHQVLLLSVLLHSTGISNPSLI